MICDGRSEARLIMLQQAANHPFSSFITTITSLI
jgi:hypothetical protein